MHDRVKGGEMHREVYDVCHFKNLLLDCSDIDGRVRTIAGELVTGVLWDLCGYTDHGITSIRVDTTNARHRWL